MRSWEELRGDFDALGIARIGISSDTVDQAAGMAEKYGFSIRLLNDADLTVTDRYNLRYTDNKTPIATTLFITADGIVRWIDVAPDYRKRTEGVQVLAAVRRALATGSEAAESTVEPVATSFGVVLVDPGKNKLQVIKAVRTITGLGLADAKALVEDAAEFIQQGLTQAEADGIAARLVQAGATVEIRPG